MPPVIDTLAIEINRKAVDHAYLHMETERGHGWKHQSTEGCLREELR